MQINNTDQLPIGAPGQLGVIRGSNPVAPACGLVTCRSKCRVTHRPRAAPSRCNSANVVCSTCCGPSGIDVDTGCPDPATSTTRAGVEDRTGSIGAAGSRGAGETSDGLNGVAPSVKESGSRTGALTEGVGSALDSGRLEARSGGGVLTASTAGSRGAGVLAGVCVGTVGSTTRTVNGSEGIADETGCSLGLGVGVAGAAVG